MKKNFCSSFIGLLLASILLFAVSAVAANNGSPASKGSMELMQPATIAGNQLPSGKYRVEWTGTGDQVDVKIYRGKDLVASTPAQMIKVDPTPYDHAAYVTGENGSKSITQISFSKQKFALRIGNESKPAATQASVK